LRDATTFLEQEIERIGVERDPVVRAAAEQLWQESTSPLSTAAGIAAGEAERT
jgi:hypothetical protein